MRRWEAHLLKFRSIASSTHVNWLCMKHNNIRVANGRIQTFYRAFKWYDWSFSTPIQPIEGCAWNYWPISQNTASLSAQHWTKTDICWFLLFTYSQFDLSLSSCFTTFHFYQFNCFMFSSRCRDVIMEPF